MAPPESLLECGSNQKKDQVQLNFPLPQGRQLGGAGGGQPRGERAPVEGGPHPAHAARVQVPTEVPQQDQGQPRSPAPPDNERARELFEGTGCDKFFE